MGYSYDMRGRLACDGCGKSGGVRKRTCPHKVFYAEGGSLPYCPPPALCAGCYASRKGSLHVGCKEAAAKRTAEETARAARRAAGELERRAAWGDWHPTVPAGKVGVLFVGGTMTPGVLRSGSIEDWRLIPAAENIGGGWLTDYPNAEPWHPHA